MAPNPLIDAKSSQKQPRSPMIPTDGQGFHKINGQNGGTPQRKLRSGGGVGVGVDVGREQSEFGDHPRNPAINDVEMQSRNPSMRRGSRAVPQRRVGGHPSTGNSMMGSYNSYGMMPMGGMGYYGGMGYGIGGMGGMMGPMGMIYSINYFISTIGQFASMLGMSTHAVTHLLCMARESLVKLEKTVRQSEFRRWLQKKSEKSSMFRWAVIIVSMLAATQVVRFARYLIEVQLCRSGGGGGGLLVNSICNLFSSSRGFSMLENNDRTANSGSVDSETSSNVTSLPSSNLS